MEKFNLYRDYEKLEGTFNSYNEALIALQRLSPHSWDYSLKHGWDIVKEGYAKTTKEHYDKYHKMAEDCNISFNGKSLFMGYTMSQLEKKFAESRYLNSIPLNEFDVYFYLWRMKGVGPRSLAENTCMYKHVLIYHVLGILPDFQED